MNDLLQAWLLHKQCGFKDMDVKRLFERSLTVVDVVAVLREFDALKAQNAELLAAQEWRDIESAPKDGTRILVYAADTHEIFSVSWMTAQEDGSQEWIAFRFDQIGAVAIHNATLWQPMPWPELARGDL